MKAVIGVDIGTGSTKAVAVDEEGRIVAAAQQYYTSQREGEKSEQDVAVVYDAFLQVLKEVAAKLPQPPLAVALSSAMHSVLCVGSDGQPLTPAMLWSDTRSSEIAAALRGTELGESLYLATGTPLHSMAPLCKLRWLQENNPAVFSRTAKFISIKEYIWWRLFNEYVIDYSIASATGLFNHQQLQWHEPALRFAGIDASRLSMPVDVTHRVTGLPAAQATGLPADTVFLVGASDGALANLGSLCLSPTQAAITIGTSAAVRTTQKKPVQDSERMIFNYRLDAKTYLCGGALNNGGNVFQWLLQNLFANHKIIKDYKTVFATMEVVPAGSNGLLFLPYLNGERSPIWDEESCGVYFGLRSQHDLTCLARAAAEGVCFALNHVLSSLEEVCGAMEQLSISGGLVQSPTMMQMLADVTGKPVVVQQKEDASAMGAVYLAQKAMGIIADYSSIKVEEAAVYKPRPAVFAVYQPLFLLFKKLYPVLKTSMHSLHQLSR